MKITGLEICKHEMKLREPYEIAYERVEGAVNVFVRIITNRSIYGIGCAAPDEKITGENPDETVRILENSALPLLKGTDPLRIYFVLEKLKKEIKRKPALLAALDMALYDIAAKYCGMPLWKYLGGYRTAIKTSITIGILGVEETLGKAKELVKSGFKVLKIKGGKSVSIDIERLIRLREELGEKIGLRFDANQGYSVEDTRRFVKQAKAAKLELIEQPTLKSDIEQLDRVTKMTAIPVMADESLLDLKDAFKLVRRGIADMINIKLMKCGGIAEAMSINALARAGGYEAMVGCMDESALGISAGLAFALSRPNVVYADLDGHLDMIGDPFKDSVMLKDGILYPVDRPGLGACLGMVFGK